MDDELPVQAGYTLWADCYDSDGNPLIALEGPAMAAWFGDLRGRRALDLGCGTGRHTRALVEAGASVVAADLTPAMLERARANLAGVGRRLAQARAAGPAPVPGFDVRPGRARPGRRARRSTWTPASPRSPASSSRADAACSRRSIPTGRPRARRRRFIDPETGRRRPIRTVHRPIGAYLASGASAGLRLVEERTLVVSEDLARSLPRARPYVGKALGWVVHWDAVIAPVASG